MFRYFLLIATVCTFTLTANESFEDIDIEETVEAVQDFLLEDHDYQKETYKLCYEAAKRAWKVGTKVSREDYKSDELLKLKVKATAVGAIPLYQQGMHLKKAVRLAKAAITLGVSELR